MEVGFQEAAPAEAEEEAGNYHLEKYIQLIHANTYETY